MGNKNDVDSMRKKLEALIQKQIKDENKDKDEDSRLTFGLSRPRRLSNLSRKKLIAEMKLLQSLKDSDTAVSVLWSFWFSECGAEAGKELVEAERLASNPNSWRLAEEKLLKLTKEYGMSWAEPLNRYATLLYQQGRLQESKIACENVLSVKPWHFGALSGIVLVSAGLNDKVNARIWAARRLPPLNTPESRADWVDMQVQEIRNMLSEKEESETIAGLNPDTFDDAWL